MSGYHEHSLRCRIPVDDHIQIIKIVALGVLLLVTAIDRIALLQHGRVDGVAVESVADHLG